MATESIDKELLENGVKDTIAADFEQEYNSSINEMSADPSKGNIARCLRLLYTSFKTASGNDKILRKMYKDLKNKYLEQKKINKNLTDTQKEENKNNRDSKGTKNTPSEKKDSISNSNSDEENNKEINKGQKNKQIKRR